MSRIAMVAMLVSVLVLAPLESASAGPAVGSDDWRHGDPPAEYAIVVKHGLSTVTLTFRSEAEATATLQRLDEARAHDQGEPAETHAGQSASGPDVQSVPAACHRPMNFVVLYESNGCQGLWQGFEAACWSNLGTWGWNNRASSLILGSNLQFVRPFTLRNFSGGFQTYTEPASTVLYVSQAGLGTLNNNISSMNVNRPAC